MLITFSNLQHLLSLPPSCITPMLFVWKLYITLSLSNLYSVRKFTLILSKIECIDPLFIYLFLRYWLSNSWPCLPCRPLCPWTKSPTLNPLFQILPFSQKSVQNNIHNSWGCLKTCHFSNSFRPIYCSNSSLNFCITYAYFYAQ